MVGKVVPAIRYLGYFLNSDPFTSSMFLFMFRTRRQIQRCRKRISSEFYFFLKRNNEAPCSFLYLLLVVNGNGKRYSFIIYSRSRAYNRDRKNANE